jgi:hypothetical protein
MHGRKSKASERLLTRDPVQMRLNKQRRTRSVLRPTRKIGPVEFAAVNGHAPTTDRRAQALETCVVRLWVSTAT